MRFDSFSTMQIEFPPSLKPKGRGKKAGLTMQLTFKPMSEEFARQLVTWRYEAPYSMYNVDPCDAEEVVRFCADPSNHYFSATNERGEFVAFRCFGQDAQVSGGDYSDDALDTGGGLRPDLTGRGVGLEVLQAGLAFGQEEFHPKAFRVTVATFNQRALRVCERAGFRETQRFKRVGDGLEFAVLLRR